MQKFTTFTGIVVPLDMAHVDTDQIVPKQFLKRVQREGFGQVLFHHHRFDQAGQVVDTFVLNHPRYAKASILLARENFGSGSSREHAPWALMDYGFKVLIAPSFADIFKNNCFQIGLLSIELAGELVDEWFKRVASQSGYRITVDLAGQTLTGSDGFACFFAVDPHRKHCLLNGLDDIGLTLEHEDRIAAYERAHAAPWQAGAPEARS
ncbi:MAG: 3-isopropylmalate dehydratase small subunit [Desulfarculus sp.]|nr:MAG: 3-isopropylmalate dehydratase small subunit [Desulfarculus sp.]